MAANAMGLFHTAGFPRKMGSERSPEPIDSKVSERQAGLMGHHAAQRGAALLW